MGGGASSQRINRRKEGDPVPDVIIKARIRVGESDEVNSFQWKDVMTADLFKGKRVVVFSIPGGIMPRASHCEQPTYCCLWNFLQPSHQSARVTTFPAT